MERGNVESVFLNNDVDLELHAKKAVELNSSFTTLFMRCTVLTSP